MVLTRRKAAELAAQRATTDELGANTNGSSEDPVKVWAETQGTGDRNSFLGLSGATGRNFALLGTVFLMVICPCVTIFLWFLLTQLEGSLERFAEFAAAVGVSGVWAAIPTPSLEAWTYLAVYGVLQAFLQIAVPGKEYRGPTTPMGNVPIYKANGVLRYLITVALFWGGWRMGYFDPARVYDLFGEMLVALNTFSLLFCLVLYIKGHVAPSSSDSGSTGSLVYDYYWGMELYPRIGRHFDLKTWTNCGMGMMGWAILLLCYAVKQQQLYGTISNSMMVSVALTEIYIFKFFMWETGYWSSMDIAHDRAGYYICWGCLNWVPALYTSPALYLVRHPVDLPLPVALSIFVAGVVCIYINYDADRQRQKFRETNGASPVWGRPPRIVHAQYVTADGSTKKSILLASGWWGIARHFHYVPEIMAAFFWTLPGGFTHLSAWFYVIFLVILLTDRAFRDDQRCLSKYGQYWVQYQQLVPAKMVPYVF